jgi:signal transduction histidine kinase
MTVRTAAPPLPLRVPGFLAALKHGYTYHPFRNRYTAFGILWGLPLSLFSIAIDLWVIGHPYRVRLFLEQPVHLLFFLHPVLFGIIFGAMGTQKHAQDRRISRLLLDLEHHVEELARVNEELKKVDQLKAQFMANVTHELKTPLVAIRGYTEAILEGRFGVLTERQRKGLAITVRNAGRLEKLIQELLEFERFDQKDRPLEKRDIDLEALVRLVLSNFQPQVEEKQLAVEVRIPEVLAVRADYESIRRVLLNLVSNAIKFTNAGAALGVSAGADPLLGRAQITVWDHGVGISPEDQKHLFTRFWQADGSSRRRYGGTGLGLAIVKEILDAHGSTLRTVSAPGEGTMMQFDLPLSPAARAGNAPRRAPAESGAPARHEAEGGLRPG